VFSLIMVGYHSAREGAVLIKVRRHLCVTFPINISSVCDHVHFRTSRLPHHL
jgi:hypothetical protein